VVFARALDIAEFGVLNVGIAISGVALVATTLGLTEVGARDAAVVPARAGWLVGRVLVARSAVLAALTVASLAVASVVWPENSAFLATAALLSLATAVSPDWLARGLERMRIVALASAAGGATVLGSALLVAYGDATPVTALAAFIVAEVVVTVICWAGVRDVRPILGASGLAPLLRRAWPVGLSSLIVYAYYANADTLILAATRSTAEAGLYSAPYRLFLALNVVPIFAAYVLLPILARSEAVGRAAEATARLEHTLKMLVWYGVAIIGVAELQSAEILTALFGTEFESAASTFVVLCAASAWYAIGYPVGYSLIARERNRDYLAGAAGAGAVNLVLNFILIPPFGIMGAGVATLASFVTATLIWMQRRELLHGGSRAPFVVLALGTGTAIFSVEFSGARREIGLVTLATAVAALSWLILRRDERPLVRQRDTGT
jgi:O-antigen/teichoic acid export membrane protein